MLEGINKRAMDVIDESSDIFVDASLEFHSAIVDLSENHSLALVAGALKVLWDSHAARVATTMEVERFTRSDRIADVRTHQAVTSAIAKGDRVSGPQYPHGPHGSRTRILVRHRRAESDRRHERRPRSSSLSCKTATRDPRDLSSPPPRRSKRPFEAEGVTIPCIRGLCQSRWRDRGRAMDKGAIP